MKTLSELLEEHRAADAAKLGPIDPAAFLKNWSRHLESRPAEDELRKDLLWGWWWSSKRAPGESTSTPPRPPDDQLPQEYLDWRDMARHASESSSET